MLTINIVCVGGLREPFYAAACAEYAKRLMPLCSLKAYEEKSDDALLLRLGKLERDFKVALCIEGKMLSSEQLASKISSLQVNGTSAVTFVIGGAEGLTEIAKSACDLRMSMSSMTFPHQLARLLITEQIYRALSINSGSGYHK